MADESINPITGQEYYSGTVEDIKKHVRMLRIDDSRLSQIKHSLVLFYMQTVDSAIDGYLDAYYQTPLRKYKIAQADGTSTSSIFPGKIVMIARNWVCGLLVQSEFQQLEPSQSDSASQYIENSKRDLFNISNLSSSRLPGQILRSSLSPTMPPGLQPSIPLEPLI